MAEQQQTTTKATEAGGEPTPAGWTLALMSQYAMGQARTLTLRADADVPTVEHLRRTNPAGPDADREELRTRTLGLLAADPAWTTYRTALERHAEAARAVELADARHAEAAAALRALQLSPETKAWASFVAQAERAEVERRAEVSKAEAALATVRRALRAALEEARPVVDAATKKAFLAVAQDRAARHAAALAAAARAVGPALEEVVLSEAALRPMTHRAGLAEELLPDPALGDDDGEAEGDLDAA